MGTIKISTSPGTKPIATIVDLEATDLYYNGSYSITPTDRKQSFPTAGKVMRGNFTVDAAPAPVIDEYYGPYVFDASTIDQTIYLENSTYSFSQDIMIRSAIIRINQEAHTSDSSIIEVDYPLCAYVGPEAFAYCSNLRHVNLPNCIYIDHSAFIECYNINTISLPECLYIGSYAFSGALTFTSSLYLPVCQVINRGAFAYNYGYGFSILSNNNIPTCQFIGSGAFSNCFGLQRVELDRTSFLQELNFGTFSNCINLLSINLYSFSFVPEYMFYNCSSISIARITFGYSSYGFSDYPYYIGRGAFCNCSRLRSLPMDQNTGFYKICRDAFANCYSLVGIDTTIKNATHGLLSLSKCQKIESGAFSKCSALEYVDIRNASYVGPYAFVDCTSLRQIIAYSSSGSIMEYAFNRCYNLNHFGPAPASLSTSTAMSVFDKITSASISIGSNLSIGQYAFSEAGKSVGITLRYYAHSVPTGCFYGTSIRSIFIYAQQIAGKAFQNCTFTSRSLDFNNCMTIGANCLQSTNITSFTASGLYTTGQRAFADCPNLETVTIFQYSSSSTYYGFVADYIFENDYKLHDVSMPFATILGSNAFKNCSSISTLSLPRIKTIGSNAFDGCVLLSEIYILNESKVKLYSTDTFNSTPIASGSGSIYIPASLYSEYMEDSIWSAFSNVLISVP